MYICRTKSTTRIVCGHKIESAFVKGVVCESTTRRVVPPGNPNAKAFYLYQTMYYKSHEGDAFCKAVRIIHAISQLDTAFSNAEEVAERSGNRWVQEEFLCNRHDTLNALGLALHTELSTIYEEAEV